MNNTPERPAAVDALRIGEVLTLRLPVLYSSARVTDLLIAGERVHVSTTELRAALPAPTAPSTAAVDALRALAKKWRVTCHAAGQGSAGNKARRQCADELEAALAIPAVPNTANVAFECAICGAMSPYEGQYHHDHVATKAGALAAPTGPAAVDEEMARRFKVAFHAARDVGTPYDEGIQHGLTAALAKPAQEAAPRGGGEADGRWWLNMGWTGPIVMRWRTPLGDWSRWHDYSPDKQGDVVRAGCEVDYAYPAPPAAQASDTGRGEALSVFDAALAAELPRVSHVEYDSHEICKHFAGKLRERIATHTPASEDSAGKDGDLTDAMIIAGERVLNEYERGQHREESVVEEMWAAMLAAREGVQS